MDAPKYLLSLPERVVRSASALTGGLLREIGEAALPAAVRRTRLYQTMVEAVLRFLIEQVGEVEGAFPAEGRLASDFLLRRTAGNGIEMIGLLTFRASPVWVLAAFADLSGAGRHLIREIGESLKAEGLIPAEAQPSTMDQVLDALEVSAGRAAESFNTLPLDIQTLREEWAAIRGPLQTMPRPGIESLERHWRDLRATATAEQRSVFELSSLMALSVVTRLPGQFVWLGKSTRAAARRASQLLSVNILDHYTQTLQEIRHEGLLPWWTREFRPYLAGAARAFHPGKRTFTDRLLRRKPPPA
ncbi:MAG: hypothetical protein KJZ84_19240 [Bryobacteraceae bacterium]|nr:hypothetical protein [Bryobacteraceae bacterium]